jgi:putative transposase
MPAGWQGVGQPPSRSTKKGTAVSTVANLRVVSKRQAPQLPDLPDEVRLALSEAAESAREGLLAMSVATGLKVMHAMMEAEITTLAGPKGRHDPDRIVVRHGGTPSSVTLGARRVPISRPRARSSEGGEVRLDTFAAFAGDDLLAETVMSRMLAGLAGRRFSAGSEPVGEKVQATASSTSRSAVSRRFVKATGDALGRLLARDLSALPVAALMVDGLHLGEHLMVVALAITTDGTKVPVGLYDGDTENTTVVTGLLADLVDRGLDTTGGLLFVLDGAKALTKAVRKVFGDAALIQRCTVHKRRNVAEHLPERERAAVDRKLVRAFGHPDPDLGLRAARELATSLDRTHPSAAASIREGLEEMFTVRRLGLSASLDRMLTTTNPVESMISVVRSTQRNVKNWKDAAMARRWTAAGMLVAERQFRRIKGHHAMPLLVAALAQHANPSQPETVAAIA